MLLPMLDETLELAGSAGAREVVIGMAHRGRLNVLAHTVGRPYEAILVEFEGESNLEADTAMPEGGTGDVKYHHGARRHLQGPHAARASRSRCRRTRATSSSSTRSSRAAPAPTRPAARAASSSTTRRSSSRC